MLHAKFITYITSQNIIAMPVPSGCNWLIIDLDLFVNYVQKVDSSVWALSFPWSILQEEYSLSFQKVKAQWLRYEVYSLHVVWCSFKHWGMGYYNPKVLSQRLVQCSQQVRCSKVTCRVWLSMAVVYKCTVYTRLTLSIQGNRNINF